MLSEYFAEHFDKDNLHHAYLIEGDKDEVMLPLFSFLESLGVSTAGNPDFTQIHVDSFKMEEALSLRAMGEQKGFSAGKKMFVVSTNSLSLDAQQTLLKMFEEPIQDTHFFLIVPEKNALIRTLISRFYHINAKSDKDKFQEAEKFLAMPLTTRIAFLKDFLAEDDEEAVALDSIRAKSLRFLNDLESVLHKDVVQNGTYFEHLFRVRKFLRQPGSSTKSLMESVALIAP